MVKVVKVAAWKIGDQFIENAKEAEAVVRREVILEMLKEQNPAEKWDHWIESLADIADWSAKNWDAIETRVKAAMAGT